MILNHILFELPRFLSGTALMTTICDASYMSNMARLLRRSIGFTILVVFDCRLSRQF